MYIKIVHAGYQFLPTHQLVSLLMPSFKLKYHFLMQIKTEPQINPQHATTGFAYVVFSFEVKLNFVFH